MRGFLYKNIHVSKEKGKERTLKQDYGQVKREVVFKVTFTLTVEEVKTGRNNVYIRKMNLRIAYFSNFLGRAS